MKAEILAVGSELLLGETIDTNSAYLARSLAALGIGLFRKAVVGDNEERVASMIAEALERVDLLVITGGLGPTPDDITREAVARALGQPLQFHQHLLDQIEARFRSFGRTMSPSNRQQAFVPQGARIVENPRGTAPSFIVEDERGTVMVLPGVPSEMRYLWENAMTPYLRDERGATSSILVRTIHATGLSESYIGELLADLMLHDNPTLGISAMRAQYELRIGARADTLAQAALLADEAERIIRERLGEHVIGAEMLEQATLNLLGEQGLSVALDEATLDAPLFRMLAGNATGRKLLRGASITPAADVRDSAAAREQAQQAAQRVREQWASDLGIGVRAAGGPGPDGFTSVWIGLAHANGSEIWERRAELASDEGWNFVATSALDGLRHFLESDRSLGS